MDKVYSYNIYLSAYLVMNVHPTGGPNAHGNNLFDFKGPSSWLDYGRAREAEVDKYFSVLYKST